MIHNEEKNKMRNERETNREDRKCEGGRGILGVDREKVRERDKERKKRQMFGREKKIGKQMMIERKENMQEQGMRKKHRKREMEGERSKIGERETKG